MRCSGALLAVLLVSSTAHATVYVWKDREGSLVVTNLTSQLRDAPSGSLVTYETTASSPARQEDGRAASASPAPDGPDAGAPSPAAGVTAASADRAASAPGAAATRTLGETSAEHLRAAATTAEHLRAAATSAEHLRAAATSPRARPAVEPRALLEIAAQAEPRKVIVRIVEPSASRLSTSDGATSLANRSPGAMGGRGGRGGRGSSMAGERPGVASDATGRVR